MSLRILVFVILRLYALYLLVQSVATAPLLVPMLSMGASESRPMWVLLEPLGMLILAAVLWLIADRLAARVVREANPSLDHLNLTLETAYTFAFVFLGLYFVLSSIASTLQQIYYLVAVVAQLPQDAPERSRAFFDLYRPALTLIAGLTSLLGAPLWSRKLVAFGTKVAP